MKRLEPASALVLNAAFIIAMGIICFTLGFVARRNTTDIRRMFQSGHWSVKAVQEKTAIKSEGDLITKKEQILFIALSVPSE